MTHSSVVPGCSLTSSHSASSSSGVAQRDGTGIAVAVGVGEALGGREAEAADLERLAQQRPHRGDLLGRRLVADGVVAHDLAAQRAVADEERRR